MIKGKTIQPFRYFISISIILPLNCFAFIFALRFLRVSAPLRALLILVFGKGKTIHGLFY
jgi:hypothetical protein